MEVVTDPYGWWVQPFVDSSIMRMALVASVLAALATAMVGTWVALRGMTFIGDALAHGVLPGVALAFVAGFDLILGALLSAVVMIAGVNLVNRRTRLPDDAGIGLLFVGMLAAAVMIASRAESWVGDLNSFLFGGVTSVTAGDIGLQAAVTALVAVATVGGYRAFLVLTFNERTAATLGLRPRLAHAVLLGMVTLAIVASFRTVGSLLVFGLLIAPAATACLVVRRVPHMMLVAGLLGSFAATLGLLVSWHHRTAGGATMAAVAVAMFFVVLAATSVKAAVSGRAAA